MGKARRQKVLKVIPQGFLHSNPPTMRSLLTSIVSLLFNILVSRSNGIPARLLYSSRWITVWMGVTGTIT